MGRTDQRQARDRPGSLVRPMPGRKIRTVAITLRVMPFILWSVMATIFLTVVVPTP